MTQRRNLNYIYVLMIAGVMQFPLLTGCNVLHLSAVQGCSPELSLDQACGCSPDLPPCGDWLTRDGSFHRPYLAHRIVNRLHDNVVTRKIAEHKEAKAAPPWPRFHPLPTHPVFYPPNHDEAPLEPIRLGEFEPAATTNL